MVNGDSGNVQPRIAIIGGGIAGLTLALFLGGTHSFSSVTIFEAKSSVDDDGGSIVIGPNAVRVLHHVSPSLVERLKQAAFVHDSVPLVSVDFAEVGRVVSGGEAQYGFPALRLFRQMLRDELLKGATSQPGVEIVYQKKCVKLTETEAESVEIAFDDGTKTEADIVIAADGIHSRSRAFIDSDARVTYSGQSTVFSFTELKKLSLESQKVAQQAFFLVAKAGSMAVLPANREGAERLFFTTLDLEDRDREAWEALANDKAKLKTMLSDKYKGCGWPTLVEELIDESQTDRYALWPFRSVEKMSRFSTPSSRIVIIGDAGHGLPPSAGQGGAMAMEDAETLAWAIKKSVRRDHVQGESKFDGLQQRLAVWESHRRERLARVVRKTKKASNLQRGTANETEQSEKEEALKRERIEEGDNGLLWLYGYDGAAWGRELK